MLAHVFPFVDEKTAPPYTAANHVVTEPVRATTTEEWLPVRRRVHPLAADVRS